MAVKLARTGLVWGLIGLLSMLFLLVGPRALRGVLASLLAVALGLESSSNPKPRRSGLRSNPLGLRT